MRTGTYDGDYDWVKRPEFMSANVHEACRSIIELCDLEQFGALSPEEWYSNFYYLRIEKCCMLARVAKTKYTRSDKQNIISFEGVAVDAEHEKRLFYNVPGLINELLPPAKSFRARFEEEGSIPDTFEIDSFLNPFEVIHEEVHPAVENNRAYSNLLKFTSFTPKPEGYVFGKNAADFSACLDRVKLGLTYVFDFANPDLPDVDENVFDESYKPLSYEHKPLEATGKDKAAICLFIQETGDNSYKYRWEVKPWDSSVRDSNKARYVTKFYEFNDRVELAKLELQKESLRRFLTLNGWEKQPLGLRFEKDVFQRD
jgi:hypothetical protein